MAWIINKLRRKDNPDSIIMGAGYYYGAKPKRKPILVDPQLLLNLHALVTGASGTGKTTFLFFIFTQLIARRCSVLIVDPHGDLSTHVLNYISLLPAGIPKPRLIVIDPIDAFKRGVVPGLNPLEVHPGRERYEVVDEMVSACRQIWPESFGERMGSILRNSFFLASEMGLTLCEIPLILTDSSVREYLAAQSSNSNVRQFFEHLARLPEREQNTWIESSRNKIEGLIQNPYIAPLFGQVKSSINLTDCINTPGTIILIRLSMNHIKAETRRLVLALFFVKLFSAILSREDIPEQERVPLYALIDEAAEAYVESIFPLLLSGGRKFSVNVWMFAQALDQYFEHGVSDLPVIMANTAIKVTFRTSRRDAETFANEQFIFSGKRIKLQDRKLWFPTGRPTFYNISEEREHAINLLMQQGRGEAIVTLSDSSPEFRPYIAWTPNIVYPCPNPEGVESLLAPVYEQIGSPLYGVKSDITGRQIELKNQTYLPCQATEGPASTAMGEDIITEE